jgi:sugar phosphate isomerase/epimerase
MFEHLCRCADLAGSLGAYCLVFGAPKNRDRGMLPDVDAFSIARDFFAKVGEVYAASNLCVGFEANPPQYGCNFATESGTAARLVRAVGSPGFRLHLDTACMHLAGESASEAIEENRDILCHFHASEPNLGAFLAPVAQHELAARALRNAHYTGWVALEMRVGEPPLPALEEAVRFVRETYGNGI